MTIWFSEDVNLTLMARISSSSAHETVFNNSERITTQRTLFDFSWLICIILRFLSCCALPQKDHFLCKDHSSVCQQAGKVRSACKADPGAVLAVPCEGIMARFQRAVIKVPHLLAEHIENTQRHARFGRNPDWKSCRWIEG